MKQRQPAGSTPDIPLDDPYHPVPPYNPTKPAKRATSTGVIICGFIAQCKCFGNPRDSTCSVDLNIPSEEISIYWYAGIGTTPCPISDGGGTDGN